MTNGRSDEDKTIRDRLESLGFDQQERLAQYRARSLKIPYANLVTQPLNPDDLSLFAQDRYKKALAVLFYKHGRDVRVGAVNPPLPATQTFIQEVERRFGVRPQVYVISQRSLQAVLAKYPPPRILQTVQDEMHISKETLQEFEQGLSRFQELGTRITTLPPTQVLTAIMAGAIQVRASDIHIEPGEKDAKLRYRIDGVLHDFSSFGREGWQLILSRIKVLTKLKLNVRDLPQDGSFVLFVDSVPYDVRVSTLPGGYGENIVMRILSRTAEVVTVKELGMKKRDFDVVDQVLRKVNGMILVTGPTGSGKTTTLVSFVRQINTPELKIITLEDPIEYRLPGVQQTQVNTRSGYTFAVGLRSILRQDPDVILVGEMRDVETAETAVHASLTGHLVFSTLHTNDASGAIPRLLDLGIKPFVLAPALNMIIAQRLVRMVCPHCHEKYTPDKATLDRIRQAMVGIREDLFDPKVLDKKDLQFVRAKGCTECGLTGYRGRRGVFEIFNVDEPMKQLILAKADSHTIKMAALKQGMTTIAQDAYLKVIDQTTTIDEVERITEE